MKVRFYSNPKSTGWLGWIENCRENVVAFIRLDGSLVLIGNHGGAWFRQDNTDIHKQVIFGEKI